METKKNLAEIVKLAFKAVGLAMGVAALVLNVLGVIGIDTQVTLLAIGLFSLAIASM